MWHISIPLFLLLNIAVGKHRDHITRAQSTADTMWHISIPLFLLLNLAVGKHRDHITRAQSTADTT
jgi:hypothetical protein